MEGVPYSQRGPSVLTRETRNNIRYSTETQPDKV